MLLVLFSSLFGNKGLCGVPSLPSCPLFEGLSTAGKIAIGSACLVVLVVVFVIIYLCYIRRRRNDYDFGLPQDLICKLNVLSLVTSLFTAIH